MARSDGFGMPSQRGGEVCCGTCKHHKKLNDGAGDAGYYCDNEDNRDAYLSVTHTIIGALTMSRGLWRDSENKVTPATPKFLLV